MTPPRLHLRPRRPEETGNLCRLERDAHRRYATLEGFAAIAAAPAIAPERFDRGETIVAEAGDEAVGYVLVQPLDGMLYIASIMVAEQASGRGIGKALLDAAHSRAMELDLPGLTLTTFRAPRWNGPWFRKQGFSPIPDERVGPGLTAVLHRHAAFLDMSARETLWSPVSG